MDTHILSDLEKAVRNGTEDDVRQFVQRNWKQLPQRLQDHLATAMLIDAIDEHERQNREFDAFQKSFIELLETLEKEK